MSTTRSGRSSTTQKPQQRSVQPITPIGSKRLCLDDNYYATYNLPHVSLVNLREEPITTITETGIDTVDRSFDFDALVFATGFDAMTGAIVAVDIRGRDGIELKDKWQDGPTTYLGLSIPEFTELLHRDRATKPVGAVKHGGLDRTTRGVD